MPFWKIMNDLVSNIRILQEDSNITLLTASYDRSVILMDDTGKIRRKILVDSPIELDSLETIPVAVRKLDDLRMIFIGCSLGGKKIYGLSPDFEIIFQRSIPDSGGVIFLKKACLKKDRDLILVGVPSRLLILEVVNNDIVVKEINLEGIPIDGYICENDILIVAEVFSQFVTVFKLDSTPPKILHMFKLNANPAAIYPIQRNSELELVIADREGRISLRKLNGEKIWSQHLFEPIMWRDIHINDLDGDGINEIILGSQKGEEDVSKKTISSLFLLDLNTGTVKYKASLKGWVKDIKILEFKDKKTLLVAAGKRLYHYTCSDKKLEIISVHKFDKAIWRLDALKMNNTYFIGMGFAEGEVGLGEITPESNIEI